jgi:hypothetical protein
MIPQGYMHTGHSASEVTHTNTPSASQQQLPATEGTVRPQFYQIASTPTTSSLSVQFVDGNLHPAKSARNSGPSDVSAMPLYHHFDDRVPPPYTALAQADDPGQPSRDYYPVTLGPETWSAAENGSMVYSTSTLPPSQPHFTFSSQPFLKDEALPGNYTWSAA